MMAKCRVKNIRKFTLELTDHEMASLWILLHHVQFEWDGERPIIDDLENIYNEIASADDFDFDGRDTQELVGEVMAREDKK